MKILRVASDIYPSVVGGLPIHAHELSRLQAKKGHEVTVYAASNGDSAPDGVRDGYSIQRFRALLKLYGNSLMPLLPVAMFRKRGSFDVIHAHSHLFFSTNVCALLRAFGSPPLVITNHGLKSQSVPSWLNDVYIPTIAKWTFKAADRIICYTENEKASLVDLGIDGEKIAVIHNGIDTDVFARSQDRTASGRLLWIGRFVPGKGVEYLIDAFAILAKKHPETELLLIGKGPLKESIERKIADMGLAQKVSIREFVPNRELPEVYKSSDVFVLPSLEEGIPRTILEAMASEVPVVCTNLPQLTDIVDGCGLLVPARDPEALAEKIDALLSDDNLARGLGQCGRERVLNRYSWEDTVKRTLKLYQELIARN